MENLNNKQSQFVKEYVIDFNGKQAAIRAGYSARSAEVTASRLLSNAKVKAAVEKEMAKLAERTEITQDKVLRDIEELRMQAKGEKQLNVAARCSELQGKYLKMFTDNVHVSGNLSHERALDELDD